MKKNILLSLLVMLGVFVITGCGGKSVEELKQEYPNEEQIIQDMEIELGNIIEGYTINGNKFINSFDKSKIKYSNYELIEPTSDSDNYLYGKFNIEYEEGKLKLTDSIEVQYLFDGKKYNYQRIMGSTNEKIFLTDCIENLEDYNGKTALNLVKEKYPDYDNYEIIKSEYMDEYKSCTYHIIGTKDFTYYTKTDTFDTQYSIGEIDEYPNFKIYANEASLYDKKVDLKLEGKWKSDSDYQSKSGAITSNPSLHIEFEKDEYGNLMLKEGYDSLYGCTYNVSGIYPEWNEYYGGYKITLEGENKRYLNYCHMDFYVKEDTIEFYCKNENPNGCGHLIME